MKRPLILVTNDDGIHANGIAVLARAAQKFGEVVVIAPHLPKSGMSHAITIDAPLKIRKTEYIEGLSAYECSGTPVDGVKIALNELLDRTPDLILSGINHGSNYSVSVLYSGTMAAAMEGYISGIPSVGFSICEYGPDANFEHCVPFAERIIAQMLEKEKEPVLLNVNFPHSSVEIKGMKFCRQAKAVWDEAFDKRVDPFQRTYYWMAGAFKNLDPGGNTDVEALEAGYVSIVPTQADLTAHKEINRLQQTWSI